MSPAISSLNTGWHRFFFTQCRGMQKDECDGETIGDFDKSCDIELAWTWEANVFPRMLERNGYCHQGR